MKKKSHSEKTRYALLAIVCVVFAFAVIMLAAVSNKTLSGKASSTTVASNTQGGVTANRYADTQSSCKDSDGGLNYDKRGSACSGNYCKTDLCSNGKLLLEYYCDKSGRLAYEKYECECVEGACQSINTPPGVPPQESEDYCKDSDGRDIYKQGQAEGVAYGSPFVFTDTCQDKTTVLEYECDGQKVYKDGLACPQGYSCITGACQKQGNVPQYGQLKEGQTNNYVVGDVKYEITAVFISDNGVSAKFMINGEATTELYAGNSDTMSDGLMITVQAVASDGSSVKFTLDKQAIPTPQGSCTDSDGKDIYTQGYIYGNSEGRDFKKYDACSNTKTVYEYLCDGSLPRGYNYDCPDGYTCVEGLCDKDIVVPTPTGGSCIWSKDPTNCGANHDGYKCVYTMVQITTAYLDSNDKSCNGRVQARFSETNIFNDCSVYKDSVKCTLNDLAVEPAYGDTKSTVKALGGLCCK
jgi:hypothetical protein